MQDRTNVPLERILQDVSAQLDTLCTQAAELEETVSKVISQNSRISGALIFEMQALDGVNQGLHDLAVLTGLLAKSTGAQTITTDQAEAICSAVKLSSTKAFFCADTSAKSARAKASPPSNLHLF